MVPPNKVFRAIVKAYITSGGKASFLDGQKIDNESVSTYKIKTAIVESVPDARVYFFGARNANFGNADTDWDLLVLTAAQHPNSVKWELQEKLFNLVTAQSGARVNLILAQETEWNTSAEFMLLKERVGQATAM